MLLYYITDRTQFPGDEAARRRSQLEKIREAAACGIDYVQLREKDLPARELERLARKARQAIQQNRVRNTRLLINSRTDVALAVGADGVHLRSDDISVTEARQIWQASCGQLLVGVSCHSEDNVAAAASTGASFAVFAPVFEKKDAPAVQSAGLEGLRQACKHKIPVLALGGVTVENARACLEAGAAGIAAIRLFQENDIRQVVAQLRALES
jgi:thiamine-phosphate pyrophosphorylase